MWSRNHKIHNIAGAFIAGMYPALTGSKSLPQSLEESKKRRWGITARKSPIGSTNNQWRMKKTPTD